MPIKEATAVAAGLNPTFASFLYLPLTLIVANIDVNQLSILGWLLILDFLTGLAKSLVLKKPIEKFKMLQGLMTKISTLIIPLLLILVSSSLGLDSKEFAFYVIAILIIAEAYSILNNIISIYEKKEVEEKDIINVLLKSIRNALYDFAIKLIDKLSKLFK